MNGEYKIPKSTQLRALPQLMMEHIGFKTDGRFVEVGAFDGKKWSNTWELAELGWRGLMCEPNPEQFGQCWDNHRDHEVAVLPVAISDRRGLTKFYLGGSLSTIKRNMVDVYNSMSWSNFTGLDEENFIMVPTATLDNLLDAFGWKPEFELLVIDVEGAELEVLAAFDIPKWAPKMVVIETHEMHPERKISYKAGVILGRLDFHGYEHVHGDQINSVLVRK
jgi:FkbM family methyltransferase